MVVNKSQIELRNYKNNYDHTWQVRGDCEEIQIVSIFFNTEEGHDNVTIDNTVYSGTDVIDQIVPRSFVVTFESDDIETRPGLTLLWQCFGDSFDRLQAIAKTHDPLEYACCSEIEATGFAKIEINRIYRFHGSAINGRHLYVEQNNVFGIWFNGEYGEAADWVIGWMTSIADQELSYGWAMSNQDTSCPSVTKEWDEWWNSQWLKSETAIVKCSSGY